MNSYRTAPRCAFALVVALVGGTLYGEEIAAVAPAASATNSANVDFRRDIRPLLSNTCFACHGPDEAERQAGLRLDLEKSAKGELESGATAIVPDKPDASELVSRIFSDDPDLMMPPPDSNRKLSARDKELLKQWVASGAKWEQHWSFNPPTRPELPTVAKQQWVRNAIDSFVLSRLEREGLGPSPEASKETLIRRLTLDLTGLPPTPAEVDAFLNDTSADAYEKLVDRLLASPRYGERMAVPWLDAARYADTHGYHIDSGRDMWPWRDWVIKAFNENKPFDQFTIEQLAGDLLPEGTDEQKLASGFNRNHMINYEGGAIPEEYLNNYIVDRVNTTSTVWLGLTVGCAQCHDHKYDPITQKEFYQFYAFFNNVPEQGLDGQQGNAAPMMKVPSQEQQTQLVALAAQIKDLEAKAAARASEAAPAQVEWEKQRLAELATASTMPTGLIAHWALDEKQGNQAADAAGQQPVATIHGNAAWVDGKAAGALSFDGNTYVDAGSTVRFERIEKFSYGAWVHPKSGGHMAVLSRMDDAAAVRGWDLYLGDGKVYAHLIHAWDSNAIRVNTKKPIELNQWTHLLVTYDGSSKAAGVKIYVNGQPQELDLTHDTLTETIVTDKPVHIGRRNPGSSFNGLIDDVRIFNRDLTAAEVAQIAGYDPIGDIVKVPAEQRNPEQVEQLKKHFLENHDQPYKELAAALAGVRKQHTDLEKAIPTAMVMQEMPQPRETFMLVRGEYDKKGEKVIAAVPTALNPLPAGAASNRLGLARWLVDPAHPLTARVAVNRFWQMYFGRGIVLTAEDFGSQGEWPSHPELLDYLATEFIASGWNVKAMQRLIVTSATYRQSSAMTPALLEKDPENRLLARGPRFRLQAEFIRDQALAMSGLLNGRIGGASVYPYQPAGLWEEMAFGGNFSAQKYTPSTGEDLYRRTMYTFWKRTVPPAALSTFDAPDREICTVRRPRTNTPLQALVLMNDPTYVEASRKLAARLMKEGGQSLEERITLAFRLAMSRKPTADEIAVVRKLFDEQLTVYRADVEAAKKLLTLGESKRDEALDAAEHAAWTMISSAILNLDETITKG